MTYKPSANTMVLVLGAALFLGSSAQAAEALQANATTQANVIEGSVSPSETAQTTAHYRVYNHGLHVVDATVDYKLTNWGYGIRTSLHAGGFLSLFMHMDVKSEASGHFEHDWVLPNDYASSGVSRGKYRSVVLSYTEGTPHIVSLSPQESDRENVSPSSLTHAIDTLSAMVLLLKSVRKTGKCDGSAHVFDGLRLSAMTSHGPVQAEVPQTFGQIYKGAALRCDFIGQQEAGFIKDSSHLDVMKAPHPGAAWFQDLPDIGLTAVRIEFEHPKLGHMVAVLDSKPTTQN